MSEGRSTSPMWGNSGEVSATVPRKQGSVFRRTAACLLNLSLTPPNAKQPIQLVFLYAWDCESTNNLFRSRRMSSNFFKRLEIIPTFCLFFENKPLENKRSDRQVRARHIRYHLHIPKGTSVCENSVPGSNHLGNIDKEGNERYLSQFSCTLSQVFKIKNRSKCSPSISSQRLYLLWLPTLSRYAQSFLRNTYTNILTIMIRSCGDVSSHQFPNCLARGIRHTQMPFYAIIPWLGVVYST